MAYLCTLDTSETLTLQVPQGRDAHVYIAPAGEDIPCRPGQNEFKLAPRKWLRVTGLSADEIDPRSAQARVKP